MATCCTRGTTALACIIAVLPCLAQAAGSVGGSFELTSDYLVRGISRSSHDAAVQLDLHYSNEQGFIVGVFASNTKINSHESTDVELSGLLGWAWSGGEDWRGRVLYNHYSYPWNAAGGEYDYDEFNAEVSYRGWLQLNLNYSPNATRYRLNPYPELVSVSERAAEINVGHRLWRSLSASGGVGYSYVGGLDGRGYVYSSAGLGYEVGALSLGLSFVDTSDGAKYLFYNQAASRRVLGTVIWRF
jgi:uncharacterized protein (TIGR02001 family)